MLRLISSSFGSKVFLREGNQLIAFLFYIYLIIIYPPDFHLLHLNLLIALFVEQIRFIFPHRKQLLLLKIFSRYQKSRRSIMLLGVWLVWFSYLNAPVATQNGQDPVVFTLQLGYVEGFRYKTENNFDVNVFLGIPYAVPPVGDLRFEVHF